MVTFSIKGGWEWIFTLLFSTAFGFPNLIVHQNHLECLLKHRLLDPTPRVQSGQVRGVAWEVAILTSLQKKQLLPLLPEPHFDNHCYTLKEGKHEAVWKWFVSELIVVPATLIVPATLNTQPLLSDQKVHVHEDLGNHKGKS